MFFVKSWVEVEQNIAIWSQEINVESFSNRYTVNIDLLTGIKTSVREASLEWK